MKEIDTTDEVYQNVNSLGIVFVYHKIDDQGSILDTFGRRAFKIDELTKSLNSVKTLQQRPKFIIIQAANEGKTFEFLKIINKTKCSVRIFCTKND